MGQTLLTYESVSMRKGKNNNKQTNNLVRHYIACEQALDNSVLPLLTQIYKVDLKFPDKVMCNIKKTKTMTTNCKKSCFKTDYMILADKATTIAGYYKRVLYFSQCWAAAMMDKFKLMFKGSMIIIY